MRFGYFFYLNIRLYQVLLLYVEYWRLRWAYTKNKVKRYNYQIRDLKSLKFDIKIFTLPSYESPILMRLS